MKKLDSIVVGTDFSAASLPAIREAARLANWHQCTLHVAHVISLEKTHANQETDTALSVLRDKVSDELRKITIEQIDFIPKIEFHIMIGHAFREICQLTHDINASLLVLGTNGNNHSKNTGIIARKCVRKAPIPVLLVSEQHEGPFHDILVAIDFSETSNKAVNIAAEIAFENKSSLHFVHIYKPVLNISDYAFCDMNSYLDSTQYKVQSAKLKDKLKDYKNRILNRYQDLNVRIEFIHHSHPSEAICSYIQSRGVDLAVLGTRGRNGIKSLLLGTTAERLIEESPCSVLAIKPDDFSYKI